MWTLAALLALAQGSPTPEHYLAPVDAWVTAGGGVSRSAVARPTRVRAPIEVGWALAVDGSIEGEPLVWDGAVYFAVRKGAEQRELHVVDLSSGRALTRPVGVRTPLTLEPAVWGGAVVYRSSPDEITAARARSGVLRPLWTVQSPGCCAALATESGVFIAGRTGLIKHALLRPTSTWNAIGAYASGPTLDAEHLLVLESEGPFRFVRRVNPTSGARGARAAIGPLRDLAQRAEARLAALPGACFVQLDAPLQLPEVDFDVTVLGLSYSHWSASRVEPLGWSAGLLGLPVTVNDGSIAVLRHDEHGPTLMHVRPGKSRDSVEALQLASSRAHPELVDAAAPPTVAGELLLIGRTAVALGDRRVLWRAPVRPTARAVPTLDWVLFVDEARRLVAIRSRAPRADPPVIPAGDLLVPGVLVLRSGVCERGDFRFERARGQITRASGSARDAWPLEDVLLLADHDGVIQCGAGPLRGIEVLAREAFAAGLVELAVQAKSSGDDALLARLLEEAALAGADDAELARLERYREDAAKSRSRPTRKSEIVAAIEAQRSQLERRRAAVFWRFWDALLGPTREQLGRELLRRTLEADPEHVAAREHVRKLLPLELRPEGAFDARDALELADVAERTALRVRVATGEGAGGRDEEVLAARAKDWRADLLSISSPNVQILTPRRGLGALARCLDHGELVCQALESLLGKRAAGHRAPAPLLIELYESRDAYLAATQRALAGGLRSMEHTRGHYDPSANVSRFYLEAHGAVDDELLAVAAHELTHHWLRARAPRWDYRPTTRADVEAGGYWLVEGFASLVEEFGFDLGSRTWSAGGRDSLGLDLVAHAAPQALIPWQRLFEMSYANFDAFGATGEIPLSRTLGAVTRPTGIDLFYAQAEAAAHYLFSAQDGALRPKLLEALESYYSGRHDAPALPARLGLEASELGARIQAHAKSILE